MLVNTKSKKEDKNKAKALFFIWNYEKVFKRGMALYTSVINCGVHKSIYSFSDSGEWTFYARDATT